MELHQFEESLPVELTQDELLEHGSDAAKAREEISSVEADHKVAKEAYKDDLSFLESKLKRHLQAISAGTEDSAWYFANGSLHVSLHGAPRA